MSVVEIVKIVSLKNIKYEKCIYEIGMTLFTIENKLREAHIVAYSDGMRENLNFVTTKNILEWAYKVTRSSGDR